VQKNVEKILYIDMDNVLVDFKSAFSQFPDETLKAYEGRLDEVPSIFPKMLPMPGAVEAFTTLSPKFDTYVLSTAPWENPSAWSDKLEWVKIYLGKQAYKRLILTHHKNLNRGDFLVDDRLSRGADKFKGKLLLFGKEPFPGWDSVVTYLLNNA
jgi:5'(3')-deoxyribonucleotidase